MVINRNTKIATLLKHHPDALVAIVSIDNKFAKLRNPLLRKLMAGRTSIAMASKIAGCSIEDFFVKLRPLGFILAGTAETEEINNKVMEQNEFIRNVKPESIIDLDVRPVLAGGTDPFHIIMDSVNNLKYGQVLRIINTFAPMPLVSVLGKKGFESYIDQVELQLVHAYFYKKQDAAVDIKVGVKDVANMWSDIADKYKGNLIELDVRNLEMPQPMHKILEALEQLPDGKALFVQHKRIPVFLLPELAERKFEYRLNEKAEGDVEIIIFRP
ncbi:MAG: DUF2249 domain-containing protein [Chitinophagaceae bacterium]|nr:DUF2249 domain-containing protein [Chitinophagaceae bacterium]MBK8951238.1 DUF2249 domain-containing protein [Chitinophagaceae bacterium]